MYISSTNPHAAFMPQSTRIKDPTGHFFGAAPRDKVLPQITPVWIHTSGVPVGGAQRITLGDVLVRPRHYRPAPSNVASIILKNSGVKLRMRDIGPPCLTDAHCRASCCPLVSQGFGGGEHRQPGVFLLLAAVPLWLARSRTQLVFSTRRRAQPN